MTKVLVVDDMHGIANLIQSVMQGAGFEAEVAYDGKEGIKCLEQDKFDLVITDILMPEKDGFDVVQFVHDKCPDTNIIAMTGGGVTISAPVALAALESKVDATIKKPVSKDELLQCVSHVMKQREKAG